MRLLHVVATGQRRGAEVFASDLVRALAEMGRFDQEVVILRGPWPAAVPYDVPVAQVRAWGRRLPGIRMDVGTLSDLRGTIGRFRPAVVQAHGGEPFKYSAFATAGHGTPIVYRRIGTAPGEIRHGLRRAAHSALLRRSQRIVAVAESIRRETVETFRVPGERVVTIPGGIDPQRLRAERSREAVRVELDIPAAAPVVIFVGALSAEKDPVAVLDLCDALSVTLPDVTCLLAGDGPMREEVAAAISARGLEERARLLGMRSDIGDLLQASDVLVLTSRTEGTPACVIEAGIAGVPVVAFGVAGVPEVLIDGVTGFVVEPGDHAALADRTLALLTDPELRRALGGAATDRYRSVFGIGEVAQKYADILAEAAAS